MAKVKPKNIEQDSSNRFVTDSDKANWNNKQDAATAINTSNIGAQSVNYANTAGSAPASDVYPWAKTLAKPTYTKSEVGLGNVDNTSDVDKPVSTVQQAALDNKVDKIAGKGLSTEDYTTSEKSKLAGIEAGANNYVHPATHPATMITEDVTHRFTTDSEKTTWNNKSDFNGDYNSLTNKPTIPSALSQLVDDSTHRVVSDTEKTTWNNKSNFSGDYNDLTNKPNVAEVLTAIKTADESISGSTTFQNDDELSNISLEANSTYTLKIVMLVYQNAVNVGFKLKLVFSDSCYYAVRVNGNKTSNPILVDTMNIQAANGTSLEINNSFSATIYYNYMLIDGTITTTNACNLTLQWAQQESNSANATVLQRGSYIQLTKVG
jgi:hypothetical protein